MKTNESGMIPLEYRCVVKLDAVEDRKGSVYLPDSQVERNQMATTKATLLAVGGNAFGDWKAPIPKVGDRVIINKYQGMYQEASMKDLYRLINDKDILAIAT